MSIETTVMFDINAKGSESGNPYVGSFKVRTLLTRRQNAVADEVRRDIIGTNPAGVMARVAMDAFVCGQLSVRVVEAPDWFKNFGIGGIDCPDFNVLEDIFALAMKAENDRKVALGLVAKEAADKMKEAKE